MSVDFAIAQLRHLYSMMIRGQVKDNVEAGKYLLGPAIEMLERIYPEIDGHKQNAQALEKQLGQCMKNYEDQVALVANLQKDLNAELEGALYLRERYQAKEEETFFDFINRLYEERIVYLPDTKNHGSDNCPTFYDKCHCTVEALDHNIDRAEMAEQKLAETLKELVLVKSQLSQARNVMDFQRTLSCGHTYTLRHTACPTCMEELKQELVAAKKVVTSTEQYEAGYGAGVNSTNEEIADLHEVIAQLKEELKTPLKKLLGAMSAELQDLKGPCKCGLYDEIGEGAPGHTSAACPPPPVEVHTSGSHECEALPPHTVCWEDAGGLIRWRNEKTSPPEEKASPPEEDIGCHGVGEDGQCGTHKPGTPGCVSTPPSTKGP